MTLIEFEEMIGLPIDKLYFLLMKSRWELLDAYAVTGREPYSREAEALGVIHNRIGKYLFVKT